MEQWLPRGYNIADDNRIKRVFSQGDNWKIEYIFSYERRN